MTSQGWTGCLAYGAIVAVALCGCFTNKPSPPKSNGVGETTPKSLENPLAPEVVANIEAFCSACHKLPLASSFPKSMWPEEVERGFEFYTLSRRNDLSPPRLGDTIRYFREQAPDELTVELPVNAPTSPVRWLEERTIAPPDENRPAISQVLLLPKQNAILTTDMQTGEVNQWSLDDWSRTPVGGGANTSRATPCDWDGDGGRDWLVAELGSFLPTDKRNGAVQVWIESEGELRPRNLATGLGRVAEAVRIDWDADGDLDVVAAEFGWKEAGALTLLHNPGAADDGGEWPRDSIDRRHGAVGARVVDLDGDGLDDLLVAFAQEHESLELWRQIKPGEFEHVVLARLVDPSQGTSWFEAVDMDADGDLDLLLTNGDSLDSPLAKPFHSLRWMRNDGDLRFVEEFIGKLPGAHQTIAVDVDLDGDQDVVAVALVTDAKNADMSKLDSIVWFERRPGQPWGRHPIKTGDSSHVAAAIVDVEKDGRPDLVVGWFRFRGEPTPAMTVYRNLPADAGNGAQKK